MSKCLNRRLHRLMDFADDVYAETVGCESGSRRRPAPALRIRKSVKGFTGPVISAEAGVIGQGAVDSPGSGNDGRRASGVDPITVTRADRRDIGPPRDPARSGLKGAASNVRTGPRTGLTAPPEAGGWLDNSAKCCREGAYQCCRSEAFAVGARRGRFCP